jgi:hypothetical protein
MMSASPTLYVRVVELASDYLGPAAPRFVDRLIRNHLGKNPEQLAERDIQQLVVWVKLSVSMLTDDTDEIEDFTSRLGYLV